MRLFEAMLNLKRPTELPDESIPEHIRRILAQQIKSVGHLELFLFLFENREQPWSITALAKEMRTNDKLVEVQLGDLTDAVIRDGSRPQILVQFRYNNIEWVAVGEEICELYRTRKHSLIDVIYGRPIDMMLSFAEAFRIIGRNS